MSSPARWRALTLLLEVECDVVHEAAGRLDRVHPLELRQRVFPSAPPITNDVAHLVESVGVEALEGEVPMRATFSARLRSVARRELDQRGHLYALAELAS